MLRNCADNLLNPLRVSHGAGNRHIYADGGGLRLIARAPRLVSPLMLVQNDVGRQTLVMTAGPAGDRPGGIAPLQNAGNNRLSKP